MSQGESGKNSIPYISWWSSMLWLHWSRTFLLTENKISLLPGPVFVTIIHPYMQTLHWGAATREISRPIYSMVIRSEILKIMLMNNNDNLMTSCHGDAFHVTLLWEETTSRLWIPPKKPLVQSLQLSFQLNAMTLMWCRCNGKIFVCFPTKPNTFLCVQYSF